MAEYHSISSPSQGLYKEKGSKFLAFAFPVSTTDEAKIKIHDLRDLHPKAVHVCFAWRIGIEKFEDRSSDDGEPNNSAGKPIFGQILSNDLTNVLVAVVRYYGGTKLGVGGLISAYKTAASEALKAADIIEKFELDHASITFDPNHTGQLTTLLKQLNIEIKSHGFQEHFHLVKVDIPKSESKKILAKFEELPQFQIELVK